MGKRKVGLEVVEYLGYRVSDIKEQLGLIRVYLPIK